MSARPKAPARPARRPVPARAAPAWVDPAWWNTRRIRRAAAALGLAQTALVTWVLSTSGYFLDDYPFLALARQGGFGRQDLTRSVFGSLVPGFQLGFSLLASLRPVPRWPAVVVPVVLYALTLFVFYRLLELLIGARFVLVPLMAVAGFSGVLAVPLVWWTAGLNVLPAVLLDLLALDALARHAHSGRRRYLVVSVLSFAGGVAFYDASSSFVAVLVAFTGLYLVDRSSWRAAGRAFAHRWWLWAGYGVPVVVNLAWRQANPGQYSLGPLPSVTEALRFIGAGWAQGFVPTTLGVSYAGLSQGGVRLLVVVLSQCIFWGLVAFSINRRRAAWRAWVLFGAGFLAIEVVAAIGRANAGTLFALNTVYWAVQPFMLSLAIGLAFWPIRVGVEAAGAAAAPAEIRPPKGAKGGRKASGAAPRRPARVVVPVGLAVVLLCALGVRTTWTSSDRAQGAANRAFVANISQSWAQAQSESAHPFVWNTAVPAAVLTPLFTPFNRVATTAGLLVSLRFDATSGRGYLVEPDGHLVPATVDVVSRERPAATGPHCARTGATARSMSVPLRTAVSPGNWFLHGRYTRGSGFTAHVGGLAVPMRGAAGEFLIPSGGLVGSAVSIQLPPHAFVCIAAADVEMPVAGPHH